VTALAADEDEDGRGGEGLKPGVHHITIGGEEEADDAEEAEDEEEERGGGGRERWGGMAEEEEAEEHKAAFGGFEGKLQFKPRPELAGPGHDVARHVIKRNSNSSFSIQIGSYDLANNICPATSSQSRMSIPRVLSLAASCDGTNNICPALGTGAVPRLG